MDTFKAFDLVEWDILKMLLKHLGFGIQFRPIIQQLYPKNTTKVLMKETKFKIFNTPLTTLAHVSFSLNLYRRTMCYNLFSQNLAIKTHRQSTYMIWKHSEMCIC